jgi:hypothetical protein
MKPVTVTTAVDRPRAEVFAFLEPLENHEAFTDHFLKHWEVVGTGHVRVKAAGERVDIRAVEAVAPERLVENTIGAGGRRVTRGTYTLIELGPSRTQIRFDLEFEQVPAHERLLLPLLRPYLRRVNRRAMDRLREQLAGRSVAA